MFKSDRIQAMSDGMFAILITILVLDFKLPDYQEGHLFEAMLKQWPILLAYVVSILIHSGHSGCFTMISLDTIVQNYPNVECHQSFSDILDNPDQLSNCFDF